jgi:hypothetical protein
VAHREAVERADTSRDRQQPSQRNVRAVGGPGRRRP